MWRREENRIVPDALDTRTACALRAIVAAIPVGGLVPDSAGLRELLKLLECYLPSLVREVHTEWECESMDGMYLDVAHKPADRTLELFGMCVLMSDQTLVAYHLKLRTAENSAVIEWIDCRLGEVRDGQMLRIPYAHYPSKSFPPLVGRLDAIEWQYHVGFGMNSAGGDAF